MSMQKAFEEPSFKNKLHFELKNVILIHFSYRLLCFHKLTNIYAFNSVMKNLKKEL